MKTNFLPVFKYMIFNNVSMSKSFVSALKVSENKTEQNLLSNVKSV